MSYAKYLTETVGVSDEIVKLLQAFPHPLFGVGIDAVAAQDAWGLGLPGFHGLKLDPAPGKGMNRDCIHNDEAERYFFHFPDGTRHHRALAGAQANSGGDSGKLSHRRGARPRPITQSSMSRLLRCASGSTAPWSR